MPPAFPKIRLHYLRLVRRVHRFFRRHPRLKVLLGPLWQRDLWLPCRDSVAGGLAIGLFFSQLPIPFQMVFSALFAARARVNLPFALLGCWVSNPLTMLPLTTWHIRFGTFLTEDLGLPVLHFLNWSVSFPKIEMSVNLGAYLMGFLTSAVLLSLLAYPLVYLFSTLMPQLLPVVARPLSLAHKRRQARRQSL